MTRAEWFHKAQVARTTLIRATDPRGYSAFEKFAEARRGDGKRKAKNAK